MNNIPVVVSGFSNHNIALRPRGIFSFGPKILLDGKPAPRKDSLYLIPDDTGKQIKFQLRYRFFDPVPDLDVAGQRVEILPPLRIYEHVWICLPLLMITFGGIFGGFCGVIALSVNYSIFRSACHPLLKYLLAGVVALCALVGYFVVCLAIASGIGMRRK